MKMKFRTVVALLGTATLALAGQSALAATCSDLLVANGECSFLTDSSGGTALYINPNNDVNVGSGVIDPFLTVQKNGTESGFSTDVKTNQLPLDDKRAEGNNQFTRSFALGDLQSVDVNGTNYYVFSLDINEPSKDLVKSTLSLTSLLIYNTGSANSVQLGKDDITDLGQLASQGWAELYDLDESEDNTVLLDYDVFGKGSGVAFDMYLLIPTTELTGNATDRIVFASAFGSDAHPSEDGFEEWHFARNVENPPACPPDAPSQTPPCFPPQEIPEPVSVALLGLGLVGLAAARRRKSA